jgi:hypothetical protein
MERKRRNKWEMSFRTFRVTARINWSAGVEWECVVGALSWSDIHVINGVSRQLVRIYS